jgi:D-arabinose 1-dehydrogenase-like Zn-dependent alcohol dehydrogenase
MRAMAVFDYGQPLRPFDAPEPDMPPGHALLEVQTCGVCATDLKIAGGRMANSGTLALPHVPGHEVFARVVRSEPPGLIDAGTPVIVYQYRPCRRCASCRRGDEVLCLDMQSWIGVTDPGGLQERIVAAVDRLIEVPPTIPPASAGPLTCAIGTAYRSVVTWGRVSLGDVVLVLGLGGVGIHVAQFAAAAGGTVLGTDTHPPTLEVAGELGIQAIDAGDDVVGRVRTLAPDGVDAVIDTIAVDGGSLAASAVRRGGRIIVVGHGAGADLRIATSRLVLDEVQLLGSRYSTRDEMAHAVAAVATGVIRPVIGMTRPLDRANEVLESLARGDVVGRAVIDVAGVT